MHIKSRTWSFRSTLDAFGLGDELQSIVGPDVTGNTPLLIALVHRLVRAFPWAGSILKIRISPGFCGGGAHKKPLTARTSFLLLESSPSRASVSELGNSNSTQLICEPDGLGKLEIKQLVKT